MVTFFFRHLSAEKTRMHEPCLGVYGTKSEFHSEEITVQVPDLPPSWGISGSETPLGPQGYAAPAVGSLQAQMHTTRLNLVKKIT